MCLSVKSDCSNILGIPNFLDFDRIKSSGKHFKQLYSSECL